MKIWNLKTKSGLIWERKEKREGEGEEEEKKRKKMEEPRLKVWMLAFGMETELKYGFMEF